MKDFLKKLLQQKETKRSTLKQRGDSSEDVNVVRSIIGEIEEIDREIAELRQQIEALPDEPIAGGATPPAEGRSQQATGGGGSAAQLATVMASFGFKQNERQAETEDPYSTLEYRKAFMAYVRTGEIREPLKLEKRADATTTTTDAAAVIPTTILNEVIRKMTNYGIVYNRTRKINIPGGVQVPISSLIPVAKWITETQVSDRQKLEMNDKVSFSYYGLECRISQTLLTSVTTLDLFEQTVTELIYEAIIKAMDEAVISGSGSGAPLGVTNDTRVPATQVVTLNDTEILDYHTWKKKVFSAMPLAYKAGANFFMASGTFETYIDGMVDNAGQPIGRVNYGITNGIQERFAGKEVIQVEDDIIKPYDLANDGDVIAVYCNLRNYAINSNLQLMMVRYTDHDKNEIVDKAILIADGKLLDPNGVVIVKKGA
ncbi:phage major capsid protein [Paenibacillus senegalimassiliensis]|uniref:phage major capsid protein n=1 Tax=Paenibacillus senegalimassiliensis TaxID=1737426 RepID=UPI00073E237C|nr:phage major capsid protein [Paenibacillus senegalimassiliensis]